MNPDTAPDGLLEKVHEILGPLPDDDKKRLEQSAGNIIMPIVLQKSTGRIIDGRHRAELNPDVPVQYLDVDEREAAQWAVTLNLARRQISPERKRELITLLRGLDFSQQDVAQMVGISQQRLSEVQGENTSITGTDNACIPDLRYKLSQEQQDEILKRLDGNETQQQVAASFGVSQQRVGQIKKKSERKKDKRQKIAQQAGGTSKIILYSDDALLRIKQFADNSIDLVVADPPYNVTDNEWDKIGSDDEYIAWLRIWLLSLRPKLKNEYNLFMFCSPVYQARIEMMLIDNGWPLKSRIIWSHRNLSMGRDVADKFISIWEMCFHCGTRPLNWPPEWNDERFDVQEHAAPQSNFEDEKLHPTSKPLSLMELFIKVGSNPGDVILDPFAGGGTTGHACLNIGNRNCVLIEREQEYISIIEKRLGIKCQE